MRTLGCISLLLACRPSAPTSAGTPAQPAEASAPAQRQPPGAKEACRISLPAAPTGAAPVAGPAFVLVDGVGVLQISDGAGRTVLALADNAANQTVMVVGPHGELWLSDWQGVRVLASDGALRTVRGVRDGPRYEQLQVRSSTDVWAVSSDIEWELVHYNGLRWRTVRRRAQFPGQYTDNKLNGLAVTSDGVWVSSWNGLWRGVGEQWERISPPTEIAAFGDLWTYRDQLILSAPAEHYLRVGDRWRALGWPAHESVRRALADIGVVAAPNLSSPTLTLRAVEDASCTRISDPVPGSTIDEFTVDASGRSWVSSDRGLAVLDVQGQLVAQWETGSLPGLTGRIVGLAVAGAGPTRLPAAQVGRRWEVLGRLTTYKSGAPLAGLEIELCSAPDRHGKCAGPPSALRTRTGADGSFRFVGVPDGPLHLLVQPPETLADCQSPFTIVGHMFTPARDCAATRTPGVCDLGQLLQCQPFELPPPR